MRWLRKWAIAAAIAAVGVSGTLLAQAAAQQEQKEKKAPRKEKVQVFEGLRGFAGAGGARIGVSLREVDQETVRERNLKAAEGALVEGVEEDSPAAKAGVKEGDLVTGFDGERVRSVRQLQRLVSETPPGRTVAIKVLRDGKSTDLSVTPEEREGPTTFAFSPNAGAEIRRGVEEGLRSVPREFRFEGPDVHTFEWRVPEGAWREGQGPLQGLEPGERVFHWFGGPGRLGASVQNLTPQLAEYFGTKEGVLVSSVNADSPASRGGLKAGDVIVSVNGSSVSSPQEVTRELSKADDGADVKLGIIRDRKSQTLIVKVEGSRPSSSVGHS